MWLLQLTLNKPVGCIFSNNDIKKITEGFQIGSIKIAEYSKIML
jgi:hypothetical protein